MMKNSEMYQQMLLLATCSGVEREANNKHKQKNHQKCVCKHGERVNEGEKLLFSTHKKAVKGAHTHPQHRRRQQSRLTEKEEEKFHHTKI
jgi:hypothetical protein